MTTTPECITCGRNDVVTDVGQPPYCDRHRPDRPALAERQVIYEVFGTISNEAGPHVRRSRSNSIIPEAELTRGVLSMHADFTTYGDGTDDAFLKINGTDRDEAIAAWGRLREACVEILPRVWGET